MIEKIFRAWSIERQRWIYFGIHDVPSWVDPSEACQFTGVEDKNQRDVYEGDIIRFEILMNSGSVEEHTRVFEEPVQFRKGYFYVDDWMLADLSSFEVIGDWMNP